MPLLDVAVGQEDGLAEAEDAQVVGVLAVVLQLPGVVQLAGQVVAPAAVQLG